MKHIEIKYRFLILMGTFGCLAPLVRAVGFPSPVTACLRAVISAFFLTVFIIFKHKNFDRQAIKASLIATICSGACIAGDWIGLFASYNYISVAVSTVCYYTNPVFVLIGASLFLKEKFTIKHLVCVVLALCGVALVSGLTIGETTAEQTKGILFALIGSVFYAGVVLISKNHPEGDPFVKTAIQLAVAAAVSAVYVFAVYNNLKLNFTPQKVAYLLILGVLLTAFAYIKYFSYIVRIPSRTVAIFSYADPVVAVLVSVIFLGEKLTLKTIVGALLILGAAIASEVVNAEHS